MAKKPDTNRKSKDILRALMDPARPDTVPWSASDLRAILEHQLAVVLGAEVHRFGETGGHSLDQVLAALGRLTGATFGSVLEDATAGLAVYGLIKNYAKASMRTDGDLPRDVARVLYVMAICSARRAGHAGISTLGDASLARETRRCLTFGWLPNRVQAALRRGTDG